MDHEERRGMNIAVLLGGYSDEREISLQSGKNACEALREAGYGRVVPIDPSDPEFIVQLKDGAFDAAFIALHGEGGEDGTIQSILSFLGIPFTGSDAIASTCAVDKDLAKLLYARAGIPIARGVAIRRGDEIDIDAIHQVVGDQAFVKPAVNGSSYGVRLVKNPGELRDAIAYSLGFGEKILVEERLQGTEVTVGVFGGDEDLRALPVVEICMPGQAEFYDLDVKYVDPTDIHRIPAHLPEDAYAEVQSLAVSAHRALGCYGISRSDFIVTESGPVILETNTIPGMTATSLFPDEVRHDGLRFCDVCARLVDLALERKQR